MPSQSAAFWLLQEARGANFYSTDTTGKWCVICSPDDVDAAWMVVCQLLKDNKVIAAKVSTASARRQTGHDTHVICVYTRDWRDKADVFRTLAVLREAGFTEPLKYKRDIDTLNPPDDSAQEFYYEG
jgi:hypothetical protein